MKYAYYISGQANRLQEIIKDDRFGYTSSKLIFVLSDDLSNSRNIEGLCKEKGISWLYYDYTNTIPSKTRKERNERLSDYILEKMMAANVDYLFVFGHHLLGGKLLVEYKDRIIVFHPSLLPHHKGFNGIDQAIENGDFVIGNSAFIIDDGIDTGKVIIQSVSHRSVKNGDDYEAALHPIVDMFYYLLKIIEEDRLVIGDQVKIKNADYGKTYFYPVIE